MSFDSIPLGDLLGDKGYIRGPFGSALKRSELKEDGIPVYEQQHAIRGDREFRYYIDEEKYKKLKRFTVKSNDLIISCSGTVGRISIINEDDPKGIISQALLILRPNTEKVSSQFLYYFFISNNGFNELINASQGAVQLNIAPRSVVENILIPTPSPETQKTIVEILKNIDNKILLNTQINQTLEFMAQAIFKSWFVDFEPVKAKIAAIEAGEDVKSVNRAAMRAISGKSNDEMDKMQAEKLDEYAQLEGTAELFPAAMWDSELGEVPEGWEVKTIQDLAKIIKGKSYKSAELAESKTALVTLKSFNRGGGYRLDGLKEYTGSYKTEQEVFAGDLIIAYTDVTQAADVIGKPAMVISDSRYEHLVISLDVAVVRPEIDAHKYFLYGLAMTNAFQNHTKSYTTGTTVLHLGKSAVPGYQFPAPSEELLKLYMQNVSPMFILVNEKIEESKNMERLRDTLLPKLLSGELSVENIELGEVGM